ncbi:unnamed protein product [Closterium sp. NIES-65]|nr:unnamed protein product [Closterium sp. NIES-65]
MDRRSRMKEAMAEGLKEARAWVQNRPEVIKAGCLALALSLLFIIYAPAFFFGLLVGASSVIGGEVLLLKHLWRKIRPPKKEGSEAGNAPAPDPSVAWVSLRPCEADEGKTGSGKLRKNVKLFAPLLRLASLEVEERVLALAGSSQGESETILLDGCDVKSFSETSGPEKRWARKFPIRISHPSRVLFQNAREFFIYFPNGRVKQAWCRALRAAAFPESEDTLWQVQVSQAYAVYLGKIRASRPDLCPYLQSQMRLLPQAVALVEQAASGAATALAEAAAAVAAIEMAHRATMHHGAYRQVDGQVGEFSGIGIASGPNGRPYPSDLSVILSGEPTCPPAAPLGSAAASDDAVATDATSAAAAAAAGAAAAAAAGAAAGAGATGGASGPGNPGESGGGGGGGGGGVGGGSSGEPEGAVQWANALLCRLYFDLSQEDALSKKLQAKFSEKLSLVITPSIMGPISCTKLSVLHLRASYSPCPPPPCLQEKLSLVITPSIMGPISCTKLSLGPIPPLIRSMRTVNLAMPGGDLALDVDLEFKGAAAMNPSFMCLMPFSLVPLFPTLASLVPSLPGGDLALDVDLEFKGAATMTIETSIDMRETQFLKMWEERDLSRAEKESERRAEYSGQVENTPLTAGSEPALSDGSAAAGGGSDGVGSAGPGAGPERLVRRGSGMGEALMSEETAAALVGDMEVAEDVTVEGAATAPATTLAKSTPTKGGRKRNIIRGVRGMVSNMANSLSQVSLSIPHVSLPHVSLPHVSLPHVSLPHVSLPHVNLPHVNLPHVNLPQVVCLPHVSLPLPPPVEPVQGELNQFNLSQARMLGNVANSLSQVSLPWVSLPQVSLSQVPLTLSFNITSVKGTLRIRVPAPPSDRLWMSFVEMPEIEMQSMPSIGDLKLKRYPMATLLIEKLKALIKRSLTGAAQLCGRQAPRHALKPPRLALIKRSLVQRSCVDAKLPFMLSHPHDCCVDAKLPFMLSHPHDW